MIIPIRCFSCGTPVSHKWETFKDRISKGEKPKKVMDDLNIEHYCCRALFMGHIDLLETVARFKKA